MSQVGNDAQVLAKGLTDGVQTHDLQPVLDQLNSDKASMSPKDYASLLNDLNKDIKTALPGVTLTDDAAQGSINLMAKDKYGMDLKLTGDAAGAANLQQVAADAQMPNPEAILSSKMQGAKLASTDASGDQNYTTADGGWVQAAKVDDGMVYNGAGKTAADQFTIKSYPTSSSVEYADNTAISFDKAANAVTLYDKNLNESGTITRNADGTVTDKKVSHFAADLKAVAQGVGVVATAAAANYDDYKIASDPNLYPIQKVWAISDVDNSAADLINTIVPPPQN